MGLKIMMQPSHEKYLSLRDRLLLLSHIAKVKVKVDTMVTVNEILEVKNRTSLLSSILFSLSLFLIVHRIK